MASVRFGILGPVEVRVDGRHLATAGRQRELLAALLLRPNTVVPSDELAGMVWPESPSPGLGHRLHTCVGRLRKSLAPGAAERLVTRDPGYLLRVAPGELDSERFTVLLAECADATRARDWTRAVHASDRALALWRGEPLLDVSALPGRSGTAAYYRERLLHLLEHRMDALIELGRHAEAAAALDRLVHEHPYRERFAAQHMTALSHAGRRAEALLVYRSTRRTLVEALGVEPGPDLTSLHQLILEGGPITASFLGQ